MSERTPDFRRNNVALPLAWVWYRQGIAVKTRWNRRQQGYDYLNRHTRVIQEADVRAVKRRKLIRSLAIIAGFAFSGYLLWHPLWKHDGTERVGDRSVIVYGDTARPLFKQCSRSSPANVQDFWSPRAQDIKQLESTLPQFLKTELRSEHDPQTRSLSDYLNFYKQYAGFVRNGRKFIYLNAVSDPLGDWSNEAEVWCDGGESAFGLEYDVRSARFSEFHFNGSPSRRGE